MDRGRVSSRLAGDDTGKDCGLFFDGSWENGQRGVQLGGEEGGCGGGVRTRVRGGDEIQEEATQRKAVYQAVYVNICVVVAGGC